MAQTSIGNYGLFGILAEGVIVNAQNVTMQVEDEDQKVPLPIWAILLIALATLCSCLCIFYIVKRLRRSSKERSLERSG